LNIKLIQSELNHRNLVATSTAGGVWQYQTISSSAALAPSYVTFLNWYGSYYVASPTVTFLFSTDNGLNWTENAPTVVGSYLYRPVVHLAPGQLDCNYEITDGRLADNEHPVIADWFVYANPILPVLPPAPGVTPAAPAPVAPPAPDIKPTLDLSRWYL
jgi:hypothetical protein